MRVSWMSSMKKSIMEEHEFINLLLINQSTSIWLLATSIKATETFSKSKQTFLQNSNDYQLMQPLAAQSRFYFLTKFLMFMLTLTLIRKLFSLHISLFELINKIGMNNTKLTIYDFSKILYTFYYI